MTIQELFYELRRLVKVYKIDIKEVSIENGVEVVIAFVL